MRIIPSATALLTVAALSVVLVACSSGTPPTAAPTGSASPATTATDPDHGLLTGTQLKAALAPASDFASGLAIDAGGSRDTGAAYVPPATADASAPDCTKLGGTSWTAVTGITGVSFAQNDYVDKSTSAELAQEIDVYRGTTARSVVAALDGIVTKCPSYNDAQTSSKVTVAARATTGLGDDACTITLTDPAWQSGTTLVAARVGTAVVTVLSSEGADNGAAAATKVAGHVVDALKGKA